MRKTPAWLKDRERPMPVMAEAPIGASRSRYTGAGEDGIIQPSKPAEKGIFEDHEGEYVVSKKDVDSNGGPISKIGRAHV